jgi:hypothetical protein
VKRRIINSDNCSDNYEHTYYHREPTMRFLALLTGAVLLPFAMITAAAADSPPPEPASTEAEQIQPIAPQTTQSPGGTQSEALEQSAEQINQDLDGRLTRGPQLRDLLNLPDGMIIRGSSRGGLGIGTEY